MIDHDPDPGTDPLAGRDPHPRERIDLWPLHDARQALLEEIVSQPGAGSTAASPARRVLVPVGIAAAIALVAGGAWFAVANDDNSGGKDDQVVAATSEEPTPSEASTDAATAPTSEPTKDRRRDKQPEIRLDSVEIGGVASLNKCLRVLDQLDAEEIETLRLRKDASPRKGGARYVVHLSELLDARIVVGDHRCRVVEVDPKERRPR